MMALLSLTVPVRLPYDCLLRRGWRSNPGGIALWDRSVGKELITWVQWEHSSGSLGFQDILGYKVLELARRVVIGCSYTLFVFFILLSGLSIVLFFL